MSVIPIRDGEGAAADDAQMVQQLPALLLKPKQAAQVLSIGERTLWSLTDTGEIPAVYIGNSKRYRLSDLAAWVAKQPTGKAEPGSA